METANKSNIFHPDRQKKNKAEGYDDSNAGYKTMNVSDFIACENAVEALQKTAVVIFFLNLCYFFILFNYFMVC